LRIAKRLAAAQACEEHHTSAALCLCEKKESASPRRVDELASKSYKSKQIKQIFIEQRIERMNQIPTLHFLHLSPRNEAQ
jgi:hypothetical protein